MWGLSFEHWFIVIGVIALLFGIKRIPQIMGDLGKSVREVRKIPEAFDDDKA